VLLGYWFVIQFFSGYQMQAIETATQGGVAWWAHVGGFVAGFTLALLLRPLRRRVQEVTEL
jgi:membrane associated rhomboid family serine protease